MGYADLNDSDEMSERLALTRMKALVRTAINHCAKARGEAATDYGIEMIRNLETYLEDYEKDLAGWEAKIDEASPSAARDYQEEKDHRRIEAMKRV